MRGFAAGISFSILSGESMNFPKPYLCLTKSEFEVLHQALEQRAERKIHLLKLIVDNAPGGWPAAEKRRGKLTGKGCGANR